ncbi:PLP-dependent aminotransferase family protein [Acidaminobacter sp. JC074]|uniref:aminotransferase-like domain-containing protein n=1 Tax=Acidaminobacter sp. JC074 TaxID=2530199 RepID=UPI001F0FE370|nr:PLP-dependent aminotransferase family protein [Acidaminobacter sp. JC074]MCH4886432.1 PLP-dependent aminotransferase family protein [Acidaminobacter sp. JC074]
MKLSSRIDVMKPSAIREAGKLIAAKKNCISFAAGLPSPDFIPVEIIKEITEKVLNENGVQALQYGPTKGHEPLLHKIKERMHKKGMPCGIENLQITTGSQQAISFSAMLFLDKGDTIITENPSYLGALASFAPFECQVKGVNADSEGMKMDELEKLLSEDKKAKMIYVVPNFSNPTGKTWSLERRQKLYELACKYDLPIIEDDPYGEIRFEGNHVPSIKSMDIENRVVYLGSFSKIFCAGLRVGWVMAAPDLIDKYEMIKQGADLQSNQLAQMQVETYLNNYDIDAQVDKIIEGYKSKRDLMCHLIDEHFPKSILRTKPEGGMFVWLDLPDGVDATDLLHKALDIDVGFVPGGPFFAEKGHENTIRLNYSTMNPDQIEIGIKKLGVLFHDEL